MAKGMLLTALDSCARTSAALADELEATPDGRGQRDSTALRADSGIESPHGDGRQTWGTAALRHSLAAYATGVTLVAAQVDGRPAGMLANSFTSVSLDPPLVSVAMGRHSPTLARLRRAPRWGISVLDEQQQALFGQLARPAPERFAGIDALSGDDGSLLLPGAAASFIVSPQDELAAGDHLIVVLRVLAHERDTGRAPLIFHGSRLHTLQG